MAVPVPVDGFCEPQFSAVERAFRDNFRERHEIGAAVCVYQRGRAVVDLWGGHHDAARTTPWTRDTIVLMNSVAKSVCTVAVHMLADRGAVDLDAPVARCWPDFAQAGKSAVTVRQVLGHLCGVVFADAAQPGDWFDYDAYVEAIAKQEPAWAPGSRGAYNSVNYGFILSQVVQGADGRRIGAFLRDEIFAPLDRDYAVGLPDSDLPRVAHVHENPRNQFWQRGAQPGSNLHRAWRGRPALESVEALLNHRRLRQGELPSFGGHGNARALARLYAALGAGGELDGVRLLRPAAAESMRALQWEGICGMTGGPMRMGLGVMRNTPPHLPMGRNLEAFGHPGSGGALAFADPESGLAFAYCTNFQVEGMGEGTRVGSLVAAAAGESPTWRPPSEQRLFVE